MLQGKRQPLPLKWPKPLRPWPLQQRSGQSLVRVRPFFLSFSEISISRDFTSLRRTPVNLGSHPYTYSGSSRPSGELREFAILERAKGVAPLGKPREFTLGGWSPLVKLGRFASRGEARGFVSLGEARELPLLAKLGDLHTPW